MRRVLSFAEHARGANRRLRRRDMRTALSQQDETKHTTGTGGETTLAPETAELCRSIANTFAELPVDAIEVPCAVA